jgi:DNA-binding GntR family transcriptional regulator
MSHDPASTDDEPLGRTVKPLTELLAERILADIIAGRLAPGDRLKEVSLARQHAVSRATVREALIALARTGYVEQVPRYGVRVAALDRDDLFHLFEIRAALMALAARNCARSPETPHAAILALVDHLERLAADPGTTPQEFSRPVLAVQGLLLRASGNLRLAPLYDQLSDIASWRLMRSRATTFHSIERRRECAEDWRAVQEAIMDGDAERAERCVQTAFAHAAASVRALREANEGEKGKRR